MRSRAPLFRPISAAALLCSLTVPTFAQPAGVPVDSPSVRNGDVGEAITEASLRFGIPEIWIRALIRAESFGNARAVSVKGAIGLMQLMPSTYAAIRTRLGLGADPFDIHDNITAGAAYMRLLFDRYGVAGMIGAYNAGPARWEAHLTGAHQLPVETIGYVSRVAPMLGVDAPAVLSSAMPAGPLSPAEAPLFVALLSGPDTEKLSADRQRVLSAIAANPRVASPSRVGSTASTQAKAENPSDALFDLGAKDRAIAEVTQPTPAVAPDTLFVASTPRRSNR